MSIVGTVQGLVEVESVYSKGYYYLVKPVNTNKKEEIHKYLSGKLVYGHTSDHFRELNPQNLNSKPESSTM